ncbi:hypothetical protein LMG29542_07477 [Paraburkholderia humisilvae]|uniref:Uncharacterized protein n=1 Tax=Paraburkholderia humisilvae TaxID=627669 RepID=A0A6J5F5T4_9BURK|nr:hypothetical protein LMG29542_07477 [Paraburkholderia humisilvae]
MYAIGLARGLCGRDAEAGRLLAGHLQRGRIGTVPASAHLRLLLTLLALVSRWLGWLLLVRDLESGRMGRS